MTSRYDKWYVTLRSFPVLSALGWKLSSNDYSPTDDSTSAECQLLPDSEVELGAWSKRVRRLSKHDVLLYVCQVVVLCLALWGLADASNRLVQQIRSLRVETCNCGDTVEEAIALGCHYDQMAAAWLPTQCYDKELSEEYATLGNGPDGTWHYWADENRTIPLTMEEVSWLGGKGRPFYQDWQWHAAHCMYYWQKQTRVPMTGVIMEPRYETILQHHVEHCRIFILSDRDQTSNAGVALHGDWAKDGVPG